MADQPRLFAAAQDFSAATLEIGDANRIAWSMLGRWRDWPNGVLALAGPHGSGKSHMAHAWAEAAGALVWDGRGRPLDAFEARDRKLVIDDADRFADEPHLALLLDAARTGGGALLLTGQEPPKAWPVALTDLRSRLAAVTVEWVGEPDDALLAKVLSRLCKARFIKLSDKAATYLTLHMERSFAAAHAVAGAIDRVHVRGSKPISVPVAARALRSLGLDPPDEGGDEDATDALPEDA